MGPTATTSLSSSIQWSTCVCCVHNNRRGSTCVGDSFPCCQPTSTYMYMLFTCCCLHVVVSCLYIVVYMLLFTCCCLHVVVSCLYIVVYMLFTCCCLHVVVYMLLFTCCCLHVFYMLLFTCCCLHVVVYMLLFTFFTCTCILARKEYTITMSSWQLSHTMATHL